jgi:hypothetical protein
MGTRRDASEAAPAMAQRRDRPPPAEDRVHDVVDLASGRIHTTPMQRSPTAKTRVQRLASVGFAADASIFAGPTYRLTPQRPYRASPQAWLDAFFNSTTGTGPPSDFFGVYGAGPGFSQIWWRAPPSFDSFEFWATCNFSFAGLGAGLAVMTLNFEVWPYQGATGAVVIDIGALRSEIQITQPAAHTVDIGFVHNGDPVLVVMVLLRPGIFDFVFHSVLLHPGSLVVHPSPPSP